MKLSYILFFLFSLQSFASTEKLFMHMEMASLSIAKKMQYQGVVHLKEAQKEIRLLQEKGITDIQMKKTVIMKRNRPFHVKTKIPLKTAAILIASTRREVSNSNYRMAAQAMGTLFKYTSTSFERAKDPYWNSWSKSLVKTPVKRMKPVKRRDYVRPKNRISSLR